MKVLSALVAYYCLACTSLVSSEPGLLVGNTRGGDEILLFGLESGSVEPFVLPGILEAPDHIVEYGGYYYISTGTTVNTSAIARVPTTFDSGDDDVEFFAFGGGLKRPYGFDFDGAILYVASFLTDQILMYWADSGDYLGVFAQGNRTEEGLCNGPNQIEIYDGKLYMTTQGSFIDELGDLNYAFASQTVVYDLETGEGQVFIPQPEPDPEGMGFISMLGLKIGCGDESILDDDCTVYTTDFAGGLRLYAFSTQELIDSQSTTYAPGAATGSLTLGDDGTIYIAGFDSEESGAIMSLMPDTDPTNTGTLSIIYSSSMEDLARPVGILFVESLDDEENFPVGPPEVSEDELATTTMAPSPAPTTAALGELLDFLESSTSGEVLQDKTSPQYSAAMWLGEKDTSGMSDAKVLQMYALATFYYASGGDDWSLCGANSLSCGDTPWLSDDNECNWAFVSCDADGAVDQIAFPASGNDLVGVLPPELSLLSGLKRFLAPENSLSGDLDVAFGGLTSLETLAMPDNRLWGTIPTGILRSNSQLGLLALGGNQFSGTIPSAITGASILSDLQLDYNSLTGTIPADIGSLLRLTNIEIQGNNFAGSVPNELYSLSRLKTLSIRENTGINGTISPLISQLTDLNVLQLGFTQLRGTIPDEMFALTDLSEMNLEGASFSGTIPEEIRLLNASLFDLYLNDNAFTGPVPEAFDHLTALETLQIQGNQLTGSISAAVCAERGLRFQQLATLIVDCSVECTCCDFCEE
ncbi:expressed unknown protein [Seminavis robusta]|uniref:L domain-like protein n=1 Tax=Seminavis robusta TaxID=568900 RepID=A0A9N8DGM6_9STRA|nr:expressed unknown protein [Seminavis robusta]|eukprot:Sro116_g057040.1 n/a (755) ;mRNA; f:50385-52891